MRKGFIKSGIAMAVGMAFFFDGLQRRPPNRICHGWER